MTPTICLTALIRARCPLVATFHASGELGWMRYGVPVWGFLIDRIDHRIAVSERAKASQNRWLPGEYEVIPNGVLVPESAPAGDREHRIVFAGRQEPRKGLQVLLRAWPDIHRRTGLRLTVAGADPLAVRLLLARLRVPDDGIDVVGFLSQDELTGTLLRAKALVAPSHRAGELRHGAHTRVRLRAARRRLGHPRLSRGADTEASPSPSRRATRTRSRMRSATSSRTSPARVAMGEAARALRDRALLVADGTRAGRLEQIATLGRSRGNHVSPVCPFLRAWGTSRFPTPLHAQAGRPEHVLALRLGAGARRPRRARARVRRDLVARPGLGQRPRRVPPRDLELDRPRVPPQHRVDAVPGALVEAHGRPGTAGGAPAAPDPRALVVRRRPARERHRSRAGSASSLAWRRCAAIFRMRRPGRARCSWGRSSRTGSSTSCRRPSSSSGCC